jgi:hypothetical protein
LAAWSDFYIDGNYKDDMISNEESNLEKSNDSRDTTSIINGTLSCFCESELKLHGFWDTTFKDYSYRERHNENASDSKKINKDLKKQQGKQICKSYIISETFKNNYAMISCMLIFIMNMTFYFIAEPIVRLVGTNYATNERAMVSCTIFLCFVLNALLMPIIL